MDKNVALIEIYIKFTLLFCFNFECVATVLKWATNTREGEKKKQKTNKSKLLRPSQGMSCLAIKVKSEYVNNFNCENKSSGNGKFVKMKTEMWKSVMRSYVEV